VCQTLPTSTFPITAVTSWRDLKVALWAAAWLARPSVQPYVEHYMIYAYSVSGIRPTFFFFPTAKYRVIQNDCQGFDNLSYTIHLVLQMQPHVISFCGVTSSIRFMFLLFPQVCRNWRLLHATDSWVLSRLSCWCL